LAWGHSHANEVVEGFDPSYTASSPWPKSQLSRWRALCLTRFRGRRLESQRVAIREFKKPNGIRADLTLRREQAQPEVTPCAAMKWMNLQPASPAGTSEKIEVPPATQLYDPFPGTVPAVGMLPPVSRKSSRAEHPPPLKKPTARHLPGRRELFRRRYLKAPATPESVFSIRPASEDRAPLREISPSRRG